MDAFWQALEQFLPKNKELRIDLLHMLATLPVKVSEVIQQLRGNYLQSFILRKI